LYRPGLLLAGALLLAPPVLAVSSAGILLRVAGHIPLWLPAILLVWLPLLFFAWFTLKSVRTSSVGIAIARPWSRWEELNWALIEHVQQEGPRIVVHSSDGRTDHFYPFTLHNGTRLRRELLMRLPAHVLDAALRADARRLLGEPATHLDASVPADPCVIHPRRIWSVALLGVSLVAILGGSGAAVELPTPFMAIPIAAAFVVVVGCTALLPVCMQTLTLTHSGMVVRGPLGRPARELRWESIQFIEQTRAERVLRLRGKRRLRCAGPGLLSAADAEVFRAFLWTFCAQRGVLTIERRRV
jgi:hypothetical protein